MSMILLADKRAGADVLENERIVAEEIVEFVVIEVSLT